MPWQPAVVLSEVKPPKLVLADLLYILLAVDILRDFLSALASLKFKCLTKPTDLHLQQLPAHNLVPDEGHASPIFLPPTQYDYCSYSLGRTRWPRMRCWRCALSSSSL